MNNQQLSNVMPFQFAMSVEVSPPARGTSLTPEFRDKGSKLFQWLGNPATAPAALQESSHDAAQQPAAAAVGGVPCPPSVQARPGTAAAGRGGGGERPPDFSVVAELGPTRTAVAASAAASASAHLHAPSSGAGAAAAASLRVGAEEPRLHPSELLPQALLDTMQRPRHWSDPAMNQQPAAPGVISIQKTGRKAEAGTSTGSGPVAAVAATPAPAPAPAAAPATAGALGSHTLPAMFSRPQPSSSSGAAVGGGGGGVRGGAVMQEVAEQLALPDAVQSHATSAARGGAGVATSTGTSTTKHGLLSSVAGRKSGSGGAATASDAEEESRRSMPPPATAPSRGAGVGSAAAASSKQVQLTAMLPLKSAMSSSSSAVVVAATPPAAAPPAAFNSHSHSHSPGSGGGSQPALSQQLVSALAEMDGVCKALQKVVTEAKTASESVQLVMGQLMLDKVSGCLPGFLQLVRRHLALPGASQDGVEQLGAATGELFGTPGGLAGPLAVDTGRFAAAGLLSGGGGGGAAALAQGPNAALPTVRAVEADREQSHRRSSSSSAAAVELTAKRNLSTQFAATGGAGAGAGAGAGGGGGRRLSGSGAAAAISLSMDSTACSPGASSLHAISSRSGDDADGEDNDAEYDEVEEASQAHGSAGVYQPVSRTRTRSHGGSKQRQAGMSDSPEVNDEDIDNSESQQVAASAHEDDVAEDIANSPGPFSSRPTPAPIAAAAPTATAPAAVPQQKRFILLGSSAARNANTADSLAQYARSSGGARTGGAGAAAVADSHDDIHSSFTPTNTPAANSSRGGAAAARSAGAAKNTTSALVSDILPSQPEPGDGEGAGGHGDGGGSGGEEEDDELQRMRIEDDHAAVHDEMHGNPLYSAQWRNALLALTMQFRHPGWRGKQAHTVAACLRGEDVFTIMSTGAGKSLTFMLPAAISPGVTVVVSPLVALVADQLKSCRAAGIPAARLAAVDALGSADHAAVEKLLMRYTEKEEAADADAIATCCAMADVCPTPEYAWSRARGRDGRRTILKLLYITPEKLNGNERTRQLLRELAADGYLERVVIDEVHCISSYGHDFRPDYKRLDIIRTQISSNVPITALTATATLHVMVHVLDVLRMGALHSADPDHRQLERRRAQALVTRTKVCRIFRNSFNRSNLQYTILSPHGSRSAVMNSVQEFLRLASADRTVREGGIPLWPSSAILYCDTRKETEAQAAKLNGDSGGIAVYYHADMDSHKSPTAKDQEMRKMLGSAAACAGLPPSATLRERCQQAWQEGRVPIVCATIAFGMGIDKPNVRLVAHMALPTSASGYFQEAGRAGRDGLTAECILTWSWTDWLTAHDRMISELEDPKKAEHMSELDRNIARRFKFKELQAMTDYVYDRSTCRRQRLLAFFGEEFPRYKCRESDKHRCDNCKSPHAAVPVDWTYEAAQICAVVQACSRAKISFAQLRDWLCDRKSSNFSDAKNYQLGNHLHGYFTAENARAAEAKPTFAVRVPNNTTGSPTADYAARMQGAEAAATAAAAAAGMPWSAWVIQQAHAALALSFVSPRDGSAAAPAADWVQGLQQQVGISSVSDSSLPPTQAHSSSGGAGASAAAAAAPVTATTVAAEASRHRGLTIGVNSLWKTGMGTLRELSQATPERWDHLLQKNPLEDTVQYLLRLLITRGYLILARPEEKPGQGHKVSAAGGYLTVDKAGAQLAQAYNSGYLPTDPSQRIVLPHFRQGFFVQQRLDTRDAASRAASLTTAARSATSGGSAGQAGAASASAAAAAPAPDPAAGKLRGKISWEVTRQGLQALFPGPFLTTIANKPPRTESEFLALPGVTAGNAPYARRVVSWVIEHCGPSPPKVVPPPAADTAAASGASSASSSGAGAMPGPTAIYATASLAGVKRGREAEASASSATSASASAAASATAWATTAAANSSAQLPPPASKRVDSVGAVERLQQPYVPAAQSVSLSASGRREPGPLLMPPPAPAPAPAPSPPAAEINPMDVATMEAEPEQYMHGYEDVMDQLQ